MKSFRAKPNSAATFRKQITHSSPLSPFFASRMQSTTKTPAANPFVLVPTLEQFRTIEADREKFDPKLDIIVTQTPSPDWKYGEGSTDATSASKTHIEVDPAAEGRSMIANYKLLVSAIPRPVSFVSTLSRDGVPNLAPFSYFQVVDHDPVILVIGFSARPGRPKDTQKNLVETGECVINILSDHFVEAANATSLDVPHGTSEWELSGLTPRDSSTVAPKRVQEAVVSIEGKLLEMKSLDYHGHAEQGKPAGALAIIEAKRFWVRGDALDKAQENVDLEILRPVVQLGGISYARVRETFELPRPSLANELKNEEKGLKNFIGNKS